MKLKHTPVYREGLIFLAWEDGSTNILDGESGVSENVIREREIEIERRKRGMIDDLLTAQESSLQTWCPECFGTGQRPACPKCGRVYHFRTK